MKFSFATVTFLSALAGVTAEKSRMVLKYDHSVDLEDVAAAVDMAGANVERQLACTRGFLITANDEGQQVLNDMEGMTVVVADDAHPVHERRLYSDVYSPQGDSSCSVQDTCLNLNPVPELTEDDVDDIKFEIINELIRGEDSFDGSLAANAGAIMRLVFHDAASFDRNYDNILSGLNGCVNKDNPGNNGLHNVQAWMMDLQGLLFSKYGIEISITDLTVLAAITTLETTTAKAKEVVPDYQGELNIKFKYGRPDITCECEVDFLPPPMTDDGSPYNSDVLDETMKFKMGLGRRKIAALMGTHTLGGMATDHSGFPAFLNQGSGQTESSWLPEGVIPQAQGRFGGNDAFDNGFYQFMFAVAWNKKETVVDGQLFQEWLAGPFTYLNNDAALAFEIDYVDEDGVACNRFGGQNGCNDNEGNLEPGCVMCPPLQNKYGDATRQFAQDQAAWLDEYSEAFQKLVDKLVPCRQLTPFMKPQSSDT